MLSHRAIATMVTLVALAIPGSVYAEDAGLAENTSPADDTVSQTPNLQTAKATVTAAQLQDYVATLADDVFEGRAVGTRGGRAAAQYIVKELRKSRLTPAGTRGDYFHACDRGGRNILVMLPGTDPVLKDEFIVVGAHYDHV